MYQTLGFLETILPAWLFVIIERMFQEVQLGLTGPFASTGVRIFWGYLLTSMLLALCSYLYYGKKDNKQLSTKGFFSFLFPKKNYLSNTMKIDLKIYFTNRVIKGLLFPLRIILSTTTITYVVNAVLSDNFTSPGFSEGPYGAIIFTVVYLLIADFSQFIGHYAQHKIPLFWQLHALHHSAKTMTPLTLYRVHPLNFMFGAGIKTVLRGFMLGTLLFLFLKEVDIYLVFGLNFFIFIFNIMGANLRHSHIWVHWGHKLNHIFVSPAHHQIHHSAAMKHWGKNNGQTLAIWDWMFGTLILPTEKIRKNLVIGLTKDDYNPHNTLRKAYTEPLANMAKMTMNFFGRVGNKISTAL